ncbi:DUF58 domain-containing protein [Cellulomonas endophytica]|uniref:DUF58 domain-containing protein n=1 Tax=Cellulomonas endophytica TaxID=2494735 RepID=UPI001010D2A9|nr:DUF58 domain-containing protein [Cellulomonas endophytica]
MHLRPTARGVALLLAGVVLLVVGALLGADDVVQVGTVALLVVAAAVVVSALRDPGRGRARIEVARSTRPATPTAGEPATVRTLVRTPYDATGSVLVGARLHEGADEELKGGRPLAIRAARVPFGAALTSTVHPVRRGVWELGPLTVTRTDVFGVVRVRRAVGGVTAVRVWPRTVPLAAPRDTLPAEPERAALGALSPAADDAALRDYREGDDLRRVHWRTSARLGELVVRTDERSGTRPATVLLDVPVDDDALEWAIVLGCSMGLALLDAGHPVRLVVAEPDDGSAPGAAGRRDRRDAHGGRERAGAHGPAGSGAVRAAYAHPATGPEARAAVLDACVDVAPAVAEATARDALGRALRALAVVAPERELVLAVLGPLPERHRSAPDEDAGLGLDLARLAASAEGWAVVRHAPTPEDSARADLTVESLGRAGWRAVAARVGEPVERTWDRLLTEAR